MPDEERNGNRSLLDKLIALLSGLPWLEVLQGLWKATRKLIQARSYRGIYEVLNYESTLELKGLGGKRATFKKREKVRYLQDNVIAYQDQACGDGEILVPSLIPPPTTALPPPPTPRTGWVFQESVDRAP